MVCCSHYSGSLGASKDSSLEPAGCSSTEDNGMPSSLTASVAVLANTFFKYYFSKQSLQILSSRKAYMKANNYVIVVVPTFSSKESPKKGNRDAYSEKKIPLTQKGP